MDVGTPTKNGLMPMRNAVVELKFRGTGIYVRICTLNKENVFHLLEISQIDVGQYYHVTMVQVYRHSSSGQVIKAKKTELTPDINQIYINTSDNSLWIYQFPYQDLSIRYIGGSNVPNYDMQTTQSDTTGLTEVTG